MEEAQGQRVDLAEEAIASVVQAAAQKDSMQTLHPYPCSSVAEVQYLSSVLQQNPAEQMEKYQKRSSLKAYHSEKEVSHQVNYSQVEVAVALCQNYSPLLKVHQ
jgi:hypothetical protein